MALTPAQRLREARRRRAEAQPPPRPPKPPPTTTRGELRARIPIAIVAIVAGVVVIAQGGITFTIAMILLGWVCLHELFGMFESANPSRLAAALALPAILLAANYGTQYHVFLMLVLAVPAVFFAVAFQRAQGGAGAIALTMLGIYYIGIALAHAVLLINLPHGDGIIVSTLIGTFVGDTGAFIGGRLLGRTKLAPQISPNKTVEGLVIGLVFGIAAVWFAGVYQDYLTGLQALLLGSVVCVVAPVGDLFASYLKRDARVKDTGSLFGAHGGALDRLDAALFTGVAAYFLWATML
ncbi:MAG TPA: phosphatidate cytidylyltransferase [Baekduia sp.]|nr:phosphatidate cytidylyltransferase [Baekduia sp.]